MSTTSKHFGLTYKEELYIFKELEKVRRETKQDFLRFKQKLASKPAVGEVPFSGLQGPGPAGSGEKGRVSCTGPQEPSGSARAKGPAARAAALPQQARAGAMRPRGRNAGAAPGKTPPFRPQDFYLRSSAFLRHRLPKRLPVIATGAGTSRPLVLMPPPAPRRKLVTPRERSARPSVAKPVLDSAPGRGAKREPAPPSETHKARERKSSSISSEEGDAEAATRRKRVRIRTHYVREGAAKPFSRSDAETVPQSDQAPLPVRVIPTSIEEIIASLQSEAQLASDQTIKDLIQSVLGQNYDIKMEVGEREGE